MSVDADSETRFGISGCAMLPTLRSNATIGRVESHLEPSSFFGSLYVGGNFNDGSNAGLSAANANNTLSNSNANIGSRLNFANNGITVVSTLPNGRKQENKRPMSVTFNVKTWDENKGVSNMRHRLNNIYENICRMDVLESASKEAMRPRKNTDEVAVFLTNKDEWLKRLQNDLIDHTLKLSEYSIYYKVERGKRRLIADLPLYPDRIVHSAIALCIEDTLNKTLIHQTHASIKGRGTHTAMMDIRKNLHNNPKIQYCLSMDVDQFFASIPSANLKLMLRDYIKDWQLLDLLDRIIDNYNETGNTGIGLGGRLSPLLANLYLSPLDHLLKEEYHVHLMERYMDNYYIFGNSKEWLHKIEKVVIANLAEMGLRLNPNTSIVPIDSTHGVDVVGWVIYSDHVLIRKKTKLRMKTGFASVNAKLDRCLELDEHDRGMMNSYIGSLKWFNSYNLRNKVVRPVLDRIQE